MDKQKVQNHSELPRIALHTRQQLDQESGFLVFPLVSGNDFSIASKHNGFIRRYVGYDFSCFVLPHPSVSKGNIGRIHSFLYRDGQFTYANQTLLETLWQKYLKEQELEALERKKDFDPQPSRAAFEKIAWHERPLQELNLIEHLYALPCDDDISADIYFFLNEFYNNFSLHHFLWLNSEEILFYAQSRHFSWNNNTPQLQYKNHLFIFNLAQEKITDQITLPFEKKSVDRNYNYYYDEEYSSDTRCRPLILFTLTPSKNTVIFQSDNDFYLISLSPLQIAAQTNILPHSCYSYLAYDFIDPHTLIFQFLSFGTSQTLSNELVQALNHKKLCYSDDHIAMHLPRNGKALSWEPFHLKTSSKVNATCQYYCHAQGVNTLERNGILEFDSCSEADLEQPYAFQSYNPQGECITSKEIPNVIFLADQNLDEGRFLALGLDTTRPKEDALTLYLGDLISQTLKPLCLFSYQEDHDLPQLALRKAYRFQTYLSPDRVRIYFNYRDPEHSKDSRVQDTLNEDNEEAEIYPYKSLVFTYALPDELISMPSPHPPQILCAAPPHYKEETYPRRYTKFGAPRYDEDFEKRVILSRDETTN